MIDDPRLQHLLGIPFAPGGRDRRGVDCWGLVRLGLRELHGIEVPEVGPYDITRRETCARLAEEQSENGLWQSVPLGRERAGDVVLCELGGMPLHVGLVVAPGVMLHVTRGGHSTLASYRSGIWARRLMGIWRWSP